METPSPMEVKDSFFEVPHGKGTISFHYPIFKEGWGRISRQMDEKGLKHPAPSEIVSLLSCAFQNRYKKIEEEIISTFNKGFIWEYTLNFYLPKSNEEINNGVILEENPKIIHHTEVLPKVTLESEELITDKSSLIQRLKNNDPLVKFVPFDFKAGIVYSSEIEKHPYIIARYGEEGAQKLAKIASDYYNKEAILNVYSYSDAVISNKVEKAFCYLGDCWYHRGPIGISAGYADSNSHNDSYAPTNRTFSFGRK